MAAGHARGRLAAGATALLLLVAGCSDDSDDASEQALAEQLVDAAHAAGVAPRLTVDVAESLYGTDAPAVCDAFDGGLSTAERTLILGNPGHGRRKTITDDAVTYASDRRPFQRYATDTSLMPKIEVAPTSAASGS